MLDESAKRLRDMASRNIERASVERVEEANAGRITSRIGVVGVEIAECRKRRSPARTVNRVQVIVGIRMSIRCSKDCSWGNTSTGSRIERSDLKVCLSRARGPGNQRDAGRSRHTGTLAHNSGGGDGIGLTHVTAQAEGLI